mmetsp:Transcript_32284/g.74591  ORF Transcript_32284/g.74591 Transcript_32284/m.74591 type:complete len:336 (-) Transcript_32284:98-1105(-)
MGSHSLRRRRLPALRSTSVALLIALVISCCNFDVRQLGRSTFVESPRRALLTHLIGTALLQAAPAGAASGSVDLYFGQGSFWRVQNQLTSLESKVLGRSGATITAITGYAGGQPAANQLVCYHNLEFPRRDYAILGHAEAVQVAGVPGEKVSDIVKVFLDSVASNVNETGGPGAEDGEEGSGKGPEFRNLLGLPGGAQSPFFKDISEANAGRLKLALGKGSDPSTAGTDVLWIYDSEKYPFFQAELYQQFRDADPSAKYPEKYHALKDALVRKGRLQAVSCPETEIADSGAVDETEDSLNFGGAGPDPFEPILGWGKPDEPTPPSMNRVQKPFLK